MQIVQELQKALNTEDVACVIDAKHLCVNSRGTDIESNTVTSEILEENLKKIKLEESF